MSDGPEPVVPAALPSAPLVRLMRWLVRGAGDERAPEAGPSAAVVLLVGVALVPPLLTLATLRVLDRQPLQGAILAALAGVTVAMVALSRRPRTLPLAGHGLAAVIVVIATLSAWRGGGLAGGALRVVGLAPVVAIFVAGTRAGATWAVITLVDIAVFGGLELSGHSFVDVLAPSGRSARGLVVALGSWTLLVGVSLVYRLGGAHVKEALTRSEARTRALLEAFPDSLFRMSREGVFLDFHSNVQLLLERTQFVGKPVSEVFPAIAPEVMVAIAAALCEHRVQDLTFELVFAGTPQRFEARVAPASHDEVLVVVRNVTERHRLRADLASAAEERLAALEEARVARRERLVAMGQLAAGVGHEINNPLSYILGNVSFARESLDTGLADPAAVRQALDEAAEGARRVSRIVDDLKLFSRAEPERVRSIRLEGAIETALKLCQHQMRHHAIVGRDLSETPRIAADADRLTQVFVNLLLNAAQSIPPGRAQENRIAIRAYTDSRGWAVVEVSDTGAGMPVDVLARALDPFFTTKAIGTGTGLGLSLSASILRSYGGDLELSSIPGAGTTAVVMLPPARVQLASTPVPESDLQSVPAAARILVVDDDPFVRRSLARLLQGYDVVSVASGREALARIRDGAPFDVVLCDVMMPEMTGLELRELLTESFPDRVGRFVFVTGGAFTAQSSQTLESTGVPVLRKPVRPEELRALIRGAAGRDGSVSAVS